MTNLEILVLALFSTYCCFCQEQWLFYKEMQKHCKKHQGVCKDCACWSCPRKLYIDEYKMNRGN